MTAPGLRLSAARGKVPRVGAFVGAFVSVFVCMCVALCLPWKICALPGPEIKLPLV